MKAFIYEKYGSAENLHLTELEKPQPKDNELLVKVEAVSLNAADKLVLAGQPLLGRIAYGLFKPKHPILGSDIAGRVTAVGKDVTQFNVGDMVMADLSGVGRGGFAEFVAAPANLCVKVAQGDEAADAVSLSAAQASALPMAAVTALQGLRMANVKAGDSVLIHGASGGVGTFAVQIAKAWGAEVTGVCSTSKTDMVRSLGADHIIDYKREDFTQNGKKYDAIIGVNGDRSPRDYSNALTPQGTYVVIGGTMGQIFKTIFQSAILSKKGGITVTSLMAEPNQEDLVAVQEMVLAGQLTPVIDRCYPFSQLPDAMRYMESGRAKGKVVITFDESKRK